MTGFGVASAVALNKAASAAQSYAGQVATVQRLTGESAEESSKLTAVFARMGVDSGGAGKLVKSLATSIVASQNASSKLAGEAGSLPREDR